MATVSSTRAASTFPVFTPLGAGTLAVAWGTYEIAAALSKNDIVQFCVIPPCSIVGGFLQGDDLDTGTETLEIDVGYTGDTDRLLDSGVITGDAITDHLPTHAAAANFLYHFNGLKDGPVAVTSETTIFGTVVAAAAAGGTGTLWCRVDYVE